MRSGRRESSSARPTGATISTKRGSFEHLTPRDLSNQLPVLDVDLMGMVEASVRWEEHRILLVIMKAAKIMTDIINNLLSGGRSKESF